METLLPMLTSIPFDLSGHPFNQGLEGQSQHRRWKTTDGKSISKNHPNYGLMDNGQAHSFSLDP